MTSSAHPEPTNTTPESEQKPTGKYLFVVLENLAFIAGSLQHLSLAASHRFVVPSIQRARPFMGEPSHALVPELREGGS